jgi:signal transduction histidine kinase
MSRFLTYSSQDPDEERRGRLSNVFLAGVIILGFVLQGIDLYSALTRAHPNALMFFVLDWVWLGCLILLWFLHRFYPRPIRHLFLLFLTLAIVNVFEIHDLDRVLVTLTVPVMMAAFLIRPASSIAYAVVASLAYSVTVLRSFILGEWGDLSLSHVFNYPSILGIFAIACIAWVVSRSLDQALAEARQRAEELHVLNEELDQRVQDRTLELAKALAREHTAAVRNRTILEAIGDGVLVTDSSDHIIMSNPAANRLAQQDLESRPLREALSDVRSDVLAEIEDYMTQEGNDNRPHIQFDWNNRTVMANIAPVALALSGDNHTSGGNVMVLRDITREAQLDRMKTIFLGSVSHELRTPMTAVKGYVELLSDLEAETLSETGRKYLSIVESNIKRLLGLANDLIDMSRIEVGEIALYCEWDQLEPIVQTAVDTVRKEFEKRGLSLEMQVGSDLPLLYLDRHRIIQVLLNLLTNAYKYTVEGGAMVRVSRVNHTVQIEISDTGLGMTEEEQTHVFERFFRAKHEVVQKVDGSGLGLTITKSLVELHGGTISFHSEYNVGTTFTINLPVHPVFKTQFNPETF